MADSKPQIYNVFQTPNQNKATQQYQIQRALADSLLSEGLKPVDTNNRMMGQIAYKISPFEGLAKMAQALSGAYGERQALDNYSNAFAPQQQLANALSPPQGGQAASAQQQASSGDQLAPGAQSTINNLTAAGIDPMMAQQIMMSGDPSAMARLAAATVLPPDVRAHQYALGQQGAAANLAQEYENKSNPGSVAAQQKVGENYAGTLPYGAPPSVALPNSTAMPSQGIPINASSIDGQIPPMNASQFGSPPPQGINPQPPSAQEFSPMNLSGMSADQAKIAMEAQKAGATEKAKAQGANVGEAILNEAQINSRLQNALSSVDEMIASVPKTSTGIPGINEETQQQILRRSSPKMAAANTRFEQLNNQIYVQELGPLIKQLGSRGNQFVENAVKQGSAVDIQGNDLEKTQALKGIKEYLLKLQGNAVNQKNILQGNQPGSGQVTHIYIPGQGLVPVGGQ